MFKYVKVGVSNILNEPSPIQRQTLEAKQSNFWTVNTQAELCAWNNFGSFPPRCLHMLNWLRIEYTDSITPAYDDSGGSGEYKCVFSQVPRFNSLAAPRYDSLNQL